MSRDTGAPIQPKSMAIRVAGWSWVHGWNEKGPLCRNSGRKELIPTSETITCPICSELIRNRSEAKP